jgi:Holliday junction resolvase RusA-like endonuclease
MKGFNVGGKVRIVASNEADLKRWRGSVAEAAQVALMGDPAWRPLLGPLRVALAFGFTWPHAAARPTWPIRRTTKGGGDIDKLARGVLDALSPSKKGRAAGWVDVWRDDSQVVELHAIKHWCGQGAATSLTLPGLIVRVWRLTIDDNPSTGQISILAEQVPS